MLWALPRSKVTLFAFMLCVMGLATLTQARVQSSPGEEVRYPSDPGLMLAGTLETPRGAGEGPFPAALIVAGTGPFTRAVFENIRARLLASGIATLVYDKRGQGRSTGEFIDTIPAMERDVAAAVAAAAPGE